MTSTKLIRNITNPLNTRLTTTEGKVTAIEARTLVDEGDNVSVLINDAGYQNAAQVDSKIQAVVGAAPAALDTLKEIADALADDDDAIAALTAVNTTQNNAIAAIQNVNTTQSNNIAALQTFETDLLNNGAPIAISEQGTLIGTFSKINFNPSFGVSGTPGANGQATISYNMNSLLIEYVNVDIDELPVFSLGSALNFLNRRGKIRRLQITSNITLQNYDVLKQHLINQSGADRTVTLPSTPEVNQEFEVINNSTSTHNLIVAGETVTPGNRHAVQWDGIEWVVM